MKGPGDAETWGGCYDHPLDPRTDDTPMQCQCGREVDVIYRTRYEIKYVCPECGIKIIFDEGITDD